MCSSRLERTFPRWSPWPRTTSPSSRLQRPTAATTSRLASTKPVQWTDHFVDCLRNHPLLNQPGAHSIYGYDYDVMGIALGRAYNMTPGALMQTKIFDPLGMTSAFIGALVRESCHPCILLPGLIPHSPLEEPL